MSELDLWGNPIKAPEPEESAPAKTDLFDIINDISETKRGVFYSGIGAEQAYSQYVVNDMLSRQPDCLFIVNELNAARGGMPKRWHHDYLMALVPRKKRYGVKIAKLEDDERVKLVMDEFDCSLRHAKDMVDLFTEHDYEAMKQRAFTGGADRKITRPRKRS